MQTIIFHSIKRNTLYEHNIIQHNIYFVYPSSSTFPWRIYTQKKEDREKSKQRNETKNNTLFKQNRFSIATFTKWRWIWCKIPITILLSNIQLHFKLIIKIIKLMNVVNKINLTERMSKFYRYIFIQ